MIFGKNYEIIRFRNGKFGRGINGHELVAAALRMEKQIGRSCVKILSKHVVRPHVRPTRNAQRCIKKRAGLFCLEDHFTAAYIP